MTAIWCSAAVQKWAIAIKIAPILAGLVAA